MYRNRRHFFWIVVAIMTACQTSAWAVAPSPTTVNASSAPAATLAAPVSLEEDDYSIYLDVLMGGFARDMREDSIMAAEVNFQNLGFSTKVNTAWQRGRFALSAGFDLGYRFTPIWSIEGGVLALQSQQLKINSGGNNGVFTLAGKQFYQGSRIAFQTWLAYGAFRADWILKGAVSWFAKVGFSYAMTHISIRDVNQTGQVSMDDAQSSHVAPMIGFGASYRFHRNWQFSVSYLCVLSPSRINNDHLFRHRPFSTFSDIEMPVIHWVGFGVGYRMAL